MALSRRKYKNKKVYTDRSRSAQEIQDDIFRKMSADEKIQVASRLTMFCLELNSLNHYAARNSRSSKSRSKNR